jgi:4-aminobutyrate aminotransferase
MVGDVRGKGLMLAVEIVKDKQSKAPVAKERDRIVEQAFESGVLMLGCGETSIRLSPALIVSQQQADYALDVLEKCISQIESGL